MSEFSSANQERQKLLSRIRLAATQQRGETQDYVTKFFEDKKKGNQKKFAGLSIGSSGIPPHSIVGICSKYSCSRNNRKMLQPSQG